MLKANRIRKIHPKAKNYKLITSNGSIVMPILFIVIAFAILLTSGQLVNVSWIDPDEKYENPTTSSDTQKQNLQLKSLKFQLKPTPATDTCNHDAFKKADPLTCKCTALMFRCENNKCVEIDQSKSSPGYEDYTCERVNRESWCNIYGREGDGWYCVGKPVIYLYPEYPMLVDVSVVTTGNIFISDPQIETLSSSKGWSQVLAHPNGILFYNDQPYRELFYETQTTDVNPPSKGFVFKTTELETKLLEYITQLGLTRSDEQKEFLDWWIPKLQALNSPYIFVSILENDEKQRIDQVTIEPKPDTFIEFIAYFKPLETEEKVEPLVLPPAPKRIGFTAVEWGGVIDY